MASFDYNFQANYNGPIDDATIAATLQSSGAATGTVSDGGGDGIFTPGESVNGGTGTVVGSLTTGDGLYLVVDTIAGPIMYGNVSDPATATPPASISTTAPADATVNTDPLPECFAAGTLIATPNGERPVEELAIGDRVCTADGRTVAVKWVGRQTVSKTFTPAERFVPVRVRKDALAQGVPHTDLLVTGDHALVIDDLAVNAAALVNGTSIVREPIGQLEETVTYYHVETEAHDAILANGVPAETFVDYLGRRAFDNYDEYVALYGEERLIEEMPRPRVSAARQLPASIRNRLGKANAA